MSIFHFKSLSKGFSSLSKTIESLENRTSLNVSNLSNTITDLIQLLLSLIVVLLVLIVVFLILLVILYFLLKILSSFFAPYNAKKDEYYVNKHVLVTGGSSGIGLELAKEYLSLGAKVTIVARDIEKLKKAKLSLEKEYPKSTVFVLSVDISSSPDNFEKALGPCISEMGTVDVLINCAGISIAGEFDKLPVHEFENMIRVNYLGSVYVTRAVVGMMKEKKEGRIVFVASQVAQVAIYGYSAYGGSKWALRALAESLQMELKPFNIFVSISYPPDTDTPGYQNEMLTKLDITKAISDSGSVFSASAVAKDIVNLSTVGYFSISTGFDGFLLESLSVGMSPVNNIFETLHQLLLVPVARIIAIFYLLNWDYIVKKMVKNSSNKEKQA